MMKPVLLLVLVDTARGFAGAFPPMGGGGATASPPPPAAGPPVPPVGANAPSTPAVFYADTAALNIAVGGMAMPPSTGKYWYDYTSLRSKFGQDSPNGGPTLYDLKLYNNEREYAFYTQGGVTHCKACKLTNTMYPLEVPATATFEGAGAVVVSGASTQRWVSTAALPGLPGLTATYDVAGDGSGSNYVSRADFKFSMLDVTFTFGPVSTSSIAASTWTVPSACSSLVPVTLSNNDQCTCTPDDCSTTNYSPPPPAAGAPGAPSPPPAKPKYTVSGIVVGGDITTATSGGVPIANARVVLALKGTSGQASAGYDCPGVMTDSQGRWTMDACCVGERMDMGSYSGFAYPPAGANYIPGPLAFIVDGSDKTNVRIHMLFAPMGYNPNMGGSLGYPCQSGGSGGGAGGGSSSAGPAPPSSASGGLPAGDVVAIIVGLLMVGALVAAFVVDQQRRSAQAGKQLIELQVGQGQGGAPNREVTGEPDKTEQVREV